MSIIYSSNNEPFTGMDFSKVDATKVYLEHYRNLLTLDFIAKSTKDFKEAREARDEMAIAERKMKFWTRQERYDHAAAMNGAMRLKKDFNIA